MKYYSVGRDGAVDVRCFYCSGDAVPCPDCEHELEVVLRGTPPSVPIAPRAGYTPFSERNTCRHGTPFNQLCSTCMAEWRASPIVATSDAKPRVVCIGPHAPVDTGMRTSWCKRCDTSLVLDGFEWKERRT